MAEQTEERVRVFISRLSGTDYEVEFASPEGVSITHSERIREDREPRNLLPYSRVAELGPGQHDLDPSEFRQPNDR